ncbi:MAG: hypothetical protein A4S09_03860 [Proteobacteria bacterium SG_bin7]|nr:MAG: hypothetical protein A4S09_03860 [Proteobacteria bacterium SG_bin7]
MYRQTSSLYQLLVVTTVILVFFQNCGQEGFNASFLAATDLNSSVATIDNGTSLQEALSASTLVSAVLPPLPGKTYFVAPNGVDTNNTSGSIAKPFKTFKNAISRMKAGDTLLIRGGTYTEQLDFQSPVRKTGTASAWIRVAGYQSEKVTIRFADSIEYGYGPIRVRGASAYFLFENLILDGTNGSYSSGWQIRDGNHHFTLRNLEFKNFKTSGLMIKASNIQIINCKIHDSTVDTRQSPPSRRYGIYASFGSNILIEGSEIYNQPGGGIVIYPGPLHNVIVRNNIIHHNNDMKTSANPGIQIWASVLKDVPGSGVIDGTQVYNNVVYSNGVNQPAGSAQGGGIEVTNGGSSNTKIWNNTIYGNRGYGIRLFAGTLGPSKNTVVQNNIVYGNTATQIINNGVNSTIDHNLTTNPLFVNASARNFRLTAASPAVNKGRSISSVKTDITGTARPKSGYFDIGAYESF